MERVLVLNASYEPLNVCSLRRAHVLVWKGKAEILEHVDRPLRSATTTFERLHVIRLVTYVRVPRGVTRRISRRVLFARDGWQCAYCGSGGNRLTLDHVVPRSRGGTVWENVVTSCAPCNHRKGDRLLEETSMKLRTTPRPPTPVLFIRLAAEHVPETWFRLPARPRTPVDRRRRNAGGNDVSPREPPPRRRALSAVGLASRPAKRPSAAGVGRRTSDVVGSLTDGAATGAGAVPVPERGRGGNIVSPRAYRDMARLTASAPRREGDRRAPAVQVLT